MRLTLDDPATAVAVPPHVLTSAFGVATTRPAGRGSVKPTPVSATVFAAGFVSVIVRPVVPPVGTVAAPKAFAMSGGATTASAAVAGLPEPPFAEPGSRRCSSAPRDSR